MTRRKWLWSALLVLPLAVTGGLLYAASQVQEHSYTCPVTGEELPCEKCCSLNQGK